MMNEELGRLYPITVKPFNPEWKFNYEHERKILKGFFSCNLRIEHIGSTAVIGLSAKPTIDILMEKPHSISDNEIIDTFTNNGYIHMKEQKNHLMFVKGYTPTSLEEISYHVHMGPLDQNWLWDRTYFRDYLNINDNYKNEYKELKQKLAKTFMNDREAYTHAKEAFINKITIEAKKYYQSNF